MSEHLAKAKAALAAALDLDVDLNANVLPAKFPRLLDIARVQATLAQAEVLERLEAALSRRPTDPRPREIRQETPQ